MLGEQEASGKEKKKMQALSFTLCWWGKINKEHNLSQRAESGVTLMGWAVHEAVKQAERAQEVSVSSAAQKIAPQQNGHQCLLCSLLILLHRPDITIPSLLFCLNPFPTFQSIIKVYWPKRRETGFGLKSPRAIWAGSDFLEGVASFPSVKLFLLSISKSRSGSKHDRSVLSLGFSIFKWLLLSDQLVCG